MGFPKFLMSSTVLAGVVFCAATVPLATFNSKTVTVQVNEDPVIMGQVQELAPPYLGIATLLSLGAGIVSLSTLGWRHSSQRLESVTEKATALEQKIQEQSYLIESLKFSDRRLVAAGLDQFLDDGTSESSLDQVDAVTQAIAPTTTPADRADRTTTANPKDSQSPASLIESDFERVPPIPQGKTEFGADVSSVFRQPFIQGTENDITPHTISPKKMAGQKDAHPVAATKINHGYPAGTEQAQLQELMNKMQKMMEQVEQLQMSQSVA